MSGVFDGNDDQNGLGFFEDRPQEAPRARPAAPRPAVPRASAPAKQAEQPPVVASPKPVEAPSAPKWASVAKSPGYKELTPAERDLARAEYFHQFVAPSIPENERAATKTFFMEQSKALDPKEPGVLERIGASLTSARQSIREFAGTTDEQIARQKAREKFRNENPNIGVMANYDAEADKGTHDPLADVPTTPELMRSMKATWNGATPEQRKKLEGARGHMGYVARQLNAKFGTGKVDMPADTLGLDPTGEARTKEMIQKANASPLADKFDRRKEARERELIRQGVRGDLAGGLAKDGAYRDVTPGQLIASADVSTFDFETRKKYNEDKFFKNPLVRGAVKGYEGYVQGIAGLSQLATDTIGADEMSEGYARVGKKSRDFAEAMGTPINSAQRNFEGAISSIAQQLPALIGGAATGSEALVLGTMFAQTFGQEYSEGRHKGQDQGDAMIRAGLYGSFEVIGEKLGLGAQLKMLRNASRGTETDLLAKWMANAITRELPGEMLTTTGQFLTDKLGGNIGLNQNAGLEEYLNQMSDTIVQTLMQTAIMGGATGGVNRAARYMKGADPTSDAAALSADFAKEDALAKWQNSGLSPSAAAPRPAPAQDAHAAGLTPRQQEVDQRARDAFADLTEPGLLEDEIPAEMILGKETPDVAPAPPAPDPVAAPAPTALAEQPAEVAPATVAVDNVAPTALVADEAKTEVPAAKKTKLTAFSHPHLDDVEVRGELAYMADQAGWAQVGGKMIRADGTDQTSDVTGRTPWIPKQAWYQIMPERLNEEDTIEAVGKALTGQPMTAKEKRVIGNMLDFAKASLEEQQKWRDQVYDEVGAESEADYATITQHADQLEELDADIPFDLTDPRVVDGKNLTDEDIDGIFGIEPKSSGVSENAVPRNASEDAQGNGTPRAPEPDSFQLAGETPAEVKAKEKQTEKTKAADRKAKQEADAKEKAEQEKKDIRARGDAAADNFKLGEDPVDALSGQQSLLDAAPAAKPDLDSMFDEIMAEESKPKTEKAAKAKKAKKGQAPEHVNNTGKPLDAKKKFEPTATGESKQQATVDEALAQKLTMDPTDFKEITDEWAALFENPESKTVLDREAKKAGFMPVDEAQKIVEGWKDHAQAQYDDIKQRIANGQKTVLSLFDHSGEWSKPWEEAGYNVIRFDIQDGQDVMDFSAEYFTENHDITDVYAILAACPCTDFTNAGSRFWKSKDEDGRTETSKELVFRTMQTIEYFRPQVWALENPVGRIQKLTGLPDPRMSFQPHHFGEPSTKITQLWGNFDTNLPMANVEPTEGTKTDQWGGSSIETKNARSETPEGFAYSFFMANNYIDTPVETRLRKDFPEASGAVSAALKAGVTEERIRELIEYDYGNWDYEEARNELMREVAKVGGATIDLDSMFDEIMAEESKPMTWKESPFGERIQAMLDSLRAIGENDMARIMENGSAFDVDSGHLTESQVAFREKLARELVAKKDASGKPIPYETMTPEALATITNTASALPKPIVDAAVQRWNEIAPTLAKLGFEFGHMDSTFPREAQDAHKKLAEIISVLNGLAPRRYQQAKAHKNLNPDAVARTEKHASEVLGIDTLAHPGVDTSKQVTLGTGVVERAPKKPKAKKTERQVKAERIESAKEEVKKQPVIGLHAALDGLNDIFGSNSVSAKIAPFAAASGVETNVPFSEDKYARSAPYFDAAVSHLGGTASDIRDVMRALIRMMREKFGDEVTVNMKPYVVRYVTDYMEGKTNAFTPSEGAEQDRTDNPAKARGSDDAVQGTAKQAGKANPGTAKKARSKRTRSTPDLIVHDDGSAPRGKGGPVEVSGETGEFRANRNDAQSRDATGSSGTSTDGVTATESEANEHVDDNAGARDVEASATFAEKVAAQHAANSLPVKLGDKESIDATLPLLLEGQREDVLFAEKRLMKPDGYGVLFANGTGTGKTYLSLGIIKRQIASGKTNGIVLVPNDAVMKEWLSSAPNVGVELHVLKDKTDAGKGVSITTYANFGDNNVLLDRAHDFVVADEAHTLMASRSANVTKSLETVRALTMHPVSARARTDMIHRELVETIYGLRAQATALADKAARFPTHEQGVEMKRLHDQLVPLEIEYRKALDAQTDLLKNVKPEDRPRLIAVSATPFAWEPNVQWAHGYLFEYPKAKESGAYNEPNPYQKFMIQNFGWRMRTGKLNEPDAKVDRSLMQVQFNMRLRKEGVLSTRMLDVDRDYDRKFVLVDGGIGARLDAALKWLRESNDGKYSMFFETVDKQFDYLTKSRLLEAIKAKAAVDIIKEHHALGRKVVVFHDFNQGGGFAPFNFEGDGNVVLKTTVGNYANRREVEFLQQEFFDAFRAEFPELMNDELAKLKSPIETFREAFPNALFNNGLEKKRDANRSIAKFNDDMQPEANLIVVQSAKNAGWSGHDKTGRYQRVLINIGMAAAPVVNIQKEGRIYRTGQMTDAVMRYLNTGTMFERIAFANSIASRSETAENLAMGDFARGLKTSFISAFEASDVYPPGAEDGKGGKEADRREATMDDYARAKSFYFGQEKKNARNKAAEGKDYFATPEPIGLKMVQWLQAKPGESLLEPSAGHGAIARWFGDDTVNKAIEPSIELASRLPLVVAKPDGIINSDFESHNIINKYDGIAMNPPFGTGGKLAMEHVAKAFGHLKDGGRIVAIIPHGPAMDKRLEEYLTGATTNARGVDTLNNPDAKFVASFDLPASTFARAGTGVRTRIVVIDRVRGGNDGTGTAGEVSTKLARQELDINELFDALEDVQVPERSVPTQAPPAMPAVVQHAHGRVVTDANNATFRIVNGKLETDAPVSKYTTRDGKVLEGVYVPDHEMAKQADAFAWKPFGAPGSFVKMRHVVRPMDSVGQQQQGFSEGENETGYTDPYETNETRPGTRPAQIRTGRMALAALARRISTVGKGGSSGSGGSTGTILGSAMFDNFVAGKPNQLVGQVIQSPGDLAVLAQVYRDPRFETFRVIFTKGDTVVGEAGYTSRLPAIVELGQDLTMMLRADKARFGADGFYMLHNHPDGAADPSASDEVLTRKIAAGVPGFRSHVVIDHNEYATIAADGTYKVIKDPSLNGVDFESNPEHAHKLLGLKMHEVDKIAALGKSLQIPGGHATLVFTTSLAKVQLLIDVPAAALLDFSPAGVIKAKALIQRLSRMSGSGGHRFLVLPEGVNGAVFRGWMRRDMLVDVISADGTSQGVILGKFGGDFLRDIGKTMAVEQRQTPYGNLRPVVKPKIGLLDTPMRLAFQKTGALAVWRGAFRLLEKTATAALDNKLGEIIKAGLIDRYGLSDAVIERHEEMRVKMIAGVRTADRFLDRLKGLSRTEYAVLYAAANNSDTATVDAMIADLPADSQAALHEIKELVRELGQEAVDLKMLDHDTFKSNELAYLHRSYLKHEADLSEGEKANRATRIKGDQFKARGLADIVSTERLLKWTPEFWGTRVKNGAISNEVVGQQFIRFERRDDPTPTANLEGIEGAPALGRLKEVVYWPAGDVTPDKFKDWHREGDWVARRVVSGNVVMRRDFSEEERKRMGEIEDIRYAMAKTLNIAIHDVEVGRYFEWLAEGTAKVQGALPADAKVVDDPRKAESRLQAFTSEMWVKVPESKVSGTSVAIYGKLAGRYVPGPVWTDIRAAKDSAYFTSQAGKMYEKVLRLWKISKTALSPAVHMNNVMANIVMADWHEVSGPQLLTAAVTWARSGRDAASKRLVEDFQDNGGELGTFALNEMQRDQLAPILEELLADAREQNDLNGLVNATSVFSLLREGMVRQAAATLAQSKAGRVATAVPQKMLDIYQLEDQIFRLAAFIKGRESGLSDREAGRYARKSFLDYDIQAPWILAAKNSGVLPFISFSYRAIPMLYQTLRDKPWKVMKLAAVLAAASAASAMFLGLDDDDEEKERRWLPDEKRGNVWGIVPKMVRMPWNTASNNPVFMDVRRFIPAGDITDTGTSHASVPLPGFLSVGGPLALMAELMTNRSMFTGKDIADQTDSGGERTAKIMDHVYKWAAPNIPMPSLGSVVPGMDAGQLQTYAWTGIVKANQRAEGAFGRDQNVPMAIGSAVGIKLEGYNPAVGQRNAVMRLKGQQQELRKKDAATKKQRAQGGLTDAQTKSRLDSSNEKRRKLEEDFRARATSKSRGLSDLLQ